MGKVQLVKSAFTIQFIHTLFDEYDPTTEDQVELIDDHTPPTIPLLVFSPSSPIYFFLPMNQGKWRQFLSKKVFYEFYNNLGNLFLLVFLPCPLVYNN